MSVVDHRHRTFTPLQGALAVLLALVGCGDSGGSPGADSGATTTSTGTDGTGGTAQTDGNGGPTGSSQGDSTGNWWGSTAGASFSGGSGGAAEGEEEGEEEGDEEGDNESFAEWFGEGTIAPGVSYDGFLEATVVDNGQEQCLLIFSTANVTWLDTCAECEFAFSYTLTDMVEEFSEGCVAAGLDPQALEGSTQAIGRAGKELYREIDGVWQPSGEVEYDQAGSLLSYAFAIP
ncbi:MAG: hypothetical protein AAGF11_44280 [Myxococcota bacterium]